jgi:tRNA(Ile)-lysidine synthase
MKFVEEFNVPYRIDRSNEESTYARNFIRNNWFPDLDKLFPGWKENVTRLTDKAKEHEALCDEILGQIHAGKMKIDRKGFLKLNSITAPAILLHFLKKEGGITDVSRSFLTDLKKLAELDTGKKISVTEKFSILRDRGYFVLQNDENSETVLNEMVIFRREISSEPVSFDGFSILLETPPVAFSEKKLHLDEEAVTFPLKVRRWKPGDTLQPFGMDGTQLVSDHLTNRKIPASVKSDARVMEDSSDRIVAILYPSFKGQERAGTISEKVRCGDTTQTILTIETVFK